jgi:HEAT repeat protein
VGYAVATRGRDDGWECGNAGGIRRAVPTTVRLEGPTELYVLYRVAERRIGEVRLASPRCTIDVGGLTLRWLTGVTASDSLDWLAALAQDDRGRRIESQAMTALALHGDDRVVERLVALARDGRSRGVRSSALFWLSQRAGDQAVGPISDAIERDPDTEVKRQAVFALSRLPREQGVPRLIDVARNNRNPQVRQQAMFWLGQSQDARALAFFEDVLRSR